MFNKKKYILVSSLFFGFLFADEITVINHTTDPVWVGVYRLRETLLGKSVGDAFLEGDGIVKIPAGERVKINRLALKVKTNRELFFSDIQGYLKRKFDSNEYKLVSKMPVSLKHGSIFHIAKKDNVLRGYGDVEWKVIEPAITAVTKTVKRIADDLRRKFAEHSHGKDKASIRKGSGLALQEIDFLTKRSSKTKRALEKVLGMSLGVGDVPRIAVCMSGGGMRAATAAHGLFQGLQEIGLLDALTYAAGLSGSTWTLASFVELGLSADKYAQHFVQALSKPHVFNPADLVHVLWKKSVHGQHISIVDLYGVFLAHTFFHNIDTKHGRQDIFLSNSQRRVINGDSFLPIYTAVEVNNGDLHWATFTPYEFGIDDFNMNIPIWSLGREFKNGESVDFAPELSLGFLMGVWGSALSGSVRNLLETQKSALPQTLFNALNDVFVELGVSDLRMAAIKVFNPLYGVEGASVRNIKKFNLMDAGYSINLPFPPLLKKERKIDVIIVMDASADVFKGAPALSQSVKYAKSKGIPLPKIDFSAITRRQVNVFADNEGTKAPTVIFLAPVKNKNYDPKFDPEKTMGKAYATEKFVYKGRDVEKLSGLIRQNIVDNKRKILDAIRNKIEQKLKKD
jgi:phospholipase A2